MHKKVCTAQLGQAKDCKKKGMQNLRLEVRVGPGLKSNIFDADFASLSTPRIPTILPSPTIHFLEEDSYSNLNVWPVCARCISVTA